MDIQNADIEGYNTRPILSREFIFTPSRSSQQTHNQPDIHDEPFVRIQREGASVEYLGVFGRHYSLRRSNWNRGKKSAAICMAFRDYVSAARFLNSGGSAFYYPGGRLECHPEGISNGAAYVMRLTFLIVLAALFTLTTTPVDLTQGLSLLLRPLKRLKVPVHEFALMMTLTLRFVPILLREAQRVKNAQLSRGVSLEGTLLARVRNLLPMLVPLFISAIRRAEDLAMAMEARSYVSDGKRTSFHELGFRIDDIELFVFTFIFLGVASAVR